MANRVTKAENGGGSSGGAVTINFIIDGGGSAVTSGLKGYVQIPYNMTITGWQLFADQSGNAEIDVWNTTYGNFPPNSGNSIAGSEKPTLTSQQNNEDLNLTTWTTAVVDGDVLAFNVDNASSVQRLTVSIIGVRT